MPEPTATEIAAEVGRGALWTVLVVVVACVAVRWLLPLALRVLKRPLQDVIQLLAACVVLPEYWVSTATRRFGGAAPPLLAYEYGYAIGWIARVIHNGIGRIFSVVAKVAGSLHPAVVAAAAGVVAIGLRTGWL